MQPLQDVAQKVINTGLPRSCCKSMMLPSVMVSLISGARLIPPGETHNQITEAVSNTKSGIAIRDRLFIWN